MFARRYDKTPQCSSTSLTAEVRGGVNGDFSRNSCLPRCGRILPINSLRFISRVRWLLSSTGKSWVTWTGDTLHQVPALIRNTHWHDFHCQIFTMMPVAACMFSVGSQQIGSCMTVCIFTIISSTKNNATFLKALLIQSGSEAQLLLWYSKIFTTIGFLVSSSICSFC